MWPENGCQLIRRIYCGISVFVDHVNAKRIDNEDLEVPTSNGVPYRGIYMVIAEAVAYHHQTRVRSREVLLELIVAPFQDWKLLDNRNLIPT